VAATSDSQVSDLDASPLVAVVGLLALTAERDLLSGVIYQLRAMVDGLLLGDAPSADIQRLSRVLAVVRPPFAP